MPQNTLGGGGVTIGNPQAQQDYTSELARALADMQAAKQMGQQADALSSPQYAQNSGALGSLAMVAQAYAGKKLRSQSTADDADARERYYRGEAAMKDAESKREAARKLAADQAERAQREADADKYGLQGRDRLRYALEGTVGELPSITPLATDQGFIGVRRDGTYQPLTPAGAQNVQIAGDVPEQVRQAIMADPQAWENGDSIDIRQPQRPLMPYEKPKEMAETLTPDEVSAAGLPTGTLAQRRPDGTISVVNKPDPSKPDGLPKLSAGEAAAVRKQHKELKDALGAFKAFDQAVNETGNLVTAQFSAEERGRLGTAYNNARSYLRVLYNTGVLQPGELPMLEKALRDPTGVAAYDPRTRGEIQAQLGELYKLTERTFDNIVENYPQLYDAEKYRAVKASQSAPPSGGAAPSSGGGVDDLLKKYGVK